MKGQHLGEFEELILLAIAHLGENAYGITIQETLDEEAGRAASVGAIYAALRRLEQKGYVESWVGGATEERGGRRKRLYRVTATGVAAVAEARRVREALWQGIDWGLAKS